ncbi:MAG: hypothetical protein M2R45_05263 [Verrucomicrobia subdivision 3 bacterium]|nr:hypothetical protein [Limisphaerales bacterium]MCS1412692.1 hypothetical protein [Limisphaerales bacterium]
MKTTFPYGIKYVIPNQIYICIVSGLIWAMRLGKS